MNRRHFLSVLFLLGVVMPAHAAVLSAGKSTEHLGGVGGRTPASGENQTFTMWLYLESRISRAASLFLYGDNRSPTDGFGLILAGDGRTANFIVIHDTSISDIRPCQIMTVGKWYFFSFQREGTTYRCYAGDEHATATLIVTHIETGLSSQGSFWGIGILGSALANDSPNARVERFKHYTAALHATRIEAERACLAPFSTMNLFSYNPFVTHTDYTSSLGSSPYTFREQGGTSFSTASGPTVVQPCKSASGRSRPWGMSR